MIDASLFRKLVKGWEKTREELLVVKKQARRVETRERKKFDKLVHLFYGAGGVGVWIKHFEDRHEVFVSVRMFVDEQIKQKAEVLFKFPHDKADQMLQKYCNFAWITGEQEKRFNEVYAALCDLRVLSGDEDLVELNDIYFVRRGKAENFQFLFDKTRAWCEE